MTSTRLVRTLMCVAIVTSAVQVVAQSSPWDATVIVEPTQALLGSEFRATIEVRNAGAEPVTIPQRFSHCGQFCGLWVVSLTPGMEEKCTYGLGCWISEWLPVYLNKMVVEPGELVTSQTIPFQLRCAGSYTVSFRCDIPSRVTEPAVHHESGKAVSNEEVWHGLVASNEVTIQGVEPEGLDAEAYEALKHNPVGGMQSSREHLLERFPTSTYAAELVNKMTPPGLQLYSVGDEIRNMEGMRMPPADLPCSGPVASACRRVGGRPSGTEAARRNAAWIDLVLEHHPTIRFADELRYKRAFAAFFLGEKADCVSRLENLSKTASPEVAARARDLLDAMKAKGLVGPPPDDQGAEQ